jgi:hypothetical protein
MNTALSLLIALIISTQHVTPLNAKYMARHQLGLDRSHPAPVVETCNPAPYEPPQLWYYLDGDTPMPTAYNDYLEDLAWHNEQFPNSCQAQPQELANPDDYAFLFEDGSYVDLDGNTGCLEGWACND